MGWVKLGGAGAASAGGGWGWIVQGLMRTLTVGVVQVVTVADILLVTGALVPGDTKMTLT